MGTQSFVRCLIVLSVVATTLVVLPQTTRAATTITDCSSADTIRTQIQAGGDFIFDCGVITITFASPIVVTQPTTIDGGGVTTLSGGGASRIFTVDPNVSLGLDQLILAGGYSSTTSASLSGGAIYNERGSVTITNCTIKDSSSTWGGAILNSVGTLVISNTTFSNNASDLVAGQSTPGIAGGAIYSFGNISITIDDSTFSGNHAQGGGAIFMDGGVLSISGGEFSNNYSSSQGGAIDSRGATTIDDVTFSENTTRYDGGALYHADRSLSITASRFNDNIATDGGAIAIDYTAYVWQTPTNPGAVTIADSSFTDNMAHARELISNGVAGGGALWNVLADVTVTGSSFNGNTTSSDFNMVTSGGGAISNRGDMSIDSSVLFDNLVEASVGAKGGGAIENLGALQITNSTFEGNGGGVYGGAILNANEDATLTIAGSTVTGNASSRGGGLFVAFGSATIENSTIAGNSATQHGGGIMNGALSVDGQTTVFPGGALTVASSTFSNNSAPEGGTLQHVLGSTTIENSILTAGATGGVCAGTIVSGGHNLVSDATCAFAASGDLNNTNPQLGPLQDNGGPTKTHELLEGSPAIDSGACPGLLNDQRGVVRPQDGDADLTATCDIGAFEVGGANLPPEAPGTPALDASSSTPNTGTFTLVWSAASDPDDDTVTYLLQHRRTSESDTAFASVPGATDLNSPTLTFADINPELEGTWVYRVIAVDDSGTSGPVSGNSTAIVVDRTLPLITITSPTDEVAYLQGSSVIADYSCSDAVSGIASCVGDVADGAAVDTQTPGQWLFEVIAIDLAGNQRSASYTYTVIDATGPDITPAITGTLGDDGWYTSDVTVSWTIADADSTISATDGCEPTTITTDTAGTTLTCEATSPGGTSSVSVTVKRDTLAPGATLAVTAGNAGDNGWYTSSVTIATTLSGSEPISGSTCTDEQFLTSDSSGVTFSGSCVSGAGLSGTPAALTVKLDLVAPAVVVAGVTAGADYPLGSVPATICETIELTSGIATPAVLSISGGPLGEVTATCSAATDNAGLTGSPASVAYTVVDSSAPTVTPSVSGTLGLNNWYISDVTVEWTVADPDSDISATDGCDRITISTDTAGQTLTCEATSAGGMASQSVTIKRDATAPIVTYGNNLGAYTTSDTVTITCQATDATSGVASSTCQAVFGPADAFGLGEHSFSAQATDLAGNVGSGTTTFVVQASYADLIDLTRQLVMNASVERSAITILAIAQRAEEAGQTFLAEMALINYRMQIQSAISRRYISAADGAELIAWSRTL